MDLTPDQMRAIRDSGVRIIAGHGCGGTEVLARRFCQQIEKGNMRPDEMLFLARTGRAVQAFRERVQILHSNGRRVLRDSHVFTMHSFCSRILRENALDAGVAPRFSILSDARRRTIAGQLADKIIEERMVDIEDLGLILDGDTTPVREGLISLHRHAHLATPVEPADPRPFLEAFERCCMEIVVPVVEPDDWPDVVVSPIRADLPKMILTAHRLVSAPDWENFDWAGLRRLRTFRGRFMPNSRSSRLNHALSSARAAFDDLVSACLDRQALMCADLVRELSAELLGRYAAEKSRLGLLDYDDLIEHAAALLRDEPEIVTRYRHAYKLVMVDDQDLDDREWGIVNAVSRSERLVCLGRPDTPDHRPGSARPIAIRDNHRSRKGILDFIDHVFGVVWGEEPHTEYLPLRHAGSFVPVAEPDVELIVVPRAFVRTPDSAVRRHRSEADAIAERILTIMGQGAEVPLIRSRRDVAGQQVCYRDIAVLLRSSSDLHTYEHVLEHHGIPARAIGACGFYDAPEIRDILNLLMVVDNPEDEEALSQVLVSPLSGIQNVENADPQEVSAFWVLIDDLAARRAQIGVVELLDAILERSRFQLRLLAMRDGLRKYANVRKLRELAWESAPIGLSGFLSQVEEQRRLGSREPELSIRREEGDAVRLMTIRDAAEMQWPVVFLADLSRRLGSEDDLAAFDPDRGLAVRPANMGGRINVPLSYREIMDVASDKTVIEEKRLLHTAMSRAEERLILVGSSDLSADYKSTYRESRSWMGWIEKALMLGPGSHRGDHDFESCRIRIDFADPRMPRRSDFMLEGTLAGRSGEEFRRGVPIESPPMDSTAFMIARDALSRCTAGEARPQRVVSRFSVSQVLDYLECPARYRYRHIIGIPDENAEPPDDPQEIEFSAADLGHCVHDLLSRVDFGGDIGHQIERLLSGVGDRSLRDESGPLVRRFIESRWCAELRDADQVLKEVPFEYIIDGKVIAGRIDTLYRNRSGWTVLDYKTGRAEDRERYELQVGIYAHAIHRLLGEMPVRAALILLTLGDEWVQDTSDGASARLASERIGEAIAAVDGGSFAHIPGEYCTYCSFSSLCRKE